MAGLNLKANFRATKQEMLSTDHARENNELKTMPCKVICHRCSIKMNQIQFNEPVLA